MHHHPSHDLEFTIEGGEDDSSSPSGGGGSLSGAMTTTNHAATTTTQEGLGGAATLPGPLYRLRESSHPIACIFHCLFKVAALLLYIFGGWLASDGRGGVSGSRFITVTVCCILLLAADFWVVKNITGRLLVGLRWWNKVEGDTTTWIFESAETTNVNKFDNTIFWTVLYATPLAWSALLVIGILRLEVGWLITVAMALSLSTANVYGYYKCSSDQKAKFRQMMQRGAEAGAMSMIRSNLFGMLGDSNGGGGSSSTMMGNNYNYPQRPPQENTYV